MSMADTDTLYARWLSGELSDSEIKALKSSGEWAELERIIKATDRLALPKYDKDAAFAKLRNTNKTKQINKDIVKPTVKKEETKIRTLTPSNQPVSQSRRTNLKWLLGAAASLLLIVGATLFLMRGTETNIASELASTKTHNLKDNSVVTLNAGSSIQYDRKNWGKNEVGRQVRLTGEAMFEVVKGNKFEVITKNGTVEVLGTSFNVRAWGDNLYVECFSGKVKVSNTQNAQKSEILTPGLAVNIVDGDMRQKKSIQNTKPEWTNATSRFYEEKLNIVFDELKRQFDVKIDIQKDNKNMGRTFSGSFTHSSLSDALEQVCKPMGLSYTISDDSKVVSVK